MIKFDNAGEIIWSRKIGAIPTGFGSSVISPRSNEYVLTGTDNSGNHVFSANISELNTTETLQYTTDRFNWNNTISKAVALPDGNFFVARTSVDTQKLSPTVAAMKLNASGEILWSVRYGRFPSIIFNNCITATTDGGFVICDVSAGGNNPNFEEMFVTKFDSGGSFLWRRGINAFENAMAQSIVEAPNGDLLVLGSRFFETTTITSLPPKADSILLVRMKKDGTTLLTSVLGLASKRSESRAIISTVDQGFAFTGIASIPGTAHQTGVLILKFIDDLSPCNSEHTLVTNGTETLKLISAFSSKNVQSTDVLDSFRSLSLMTSSTDLCSLSTDSEPRYSQKQNAPLFTASVNNGNEIVIHIPLSAETGNDELFLLDLFGHTLKKEAVRIDGLPKDIRFDVSSFANGVYFLELKSGETTVFYSKFIKQK
jgi:hypothetical protein